MIDRKFCRNVGNIMGLFESISQSKDIRGITLNSQNIDLFNIIEQANSREEAVIKINEYLGDILQANIISKEMDKQGLSTAQKIKKVVDEKASDGINKEDFYKFLSENTMQIRANWDSKERLQDIFADKQIDSSYIDEILNLKKYFAYQTHGILTFLVDKNGNTINPESTDIKIDKDKTYQKVQALYEYVIGSLSNEENRFNRLTLDGQGKFGTVAGAMKTEREVNAKPEDYNLEPLKQGYNFAQRNGMKEVYINALVFFKDFPDRLVGENAEQYKIALTNYGKAIASVANEYEGKGIHTAIDMFNEFVDYYEPFSERTNNWMSKLSVEDLCEIALDLKKEMPNVDFGYNDWNFENDNKRKAIFEVIRKIQNFEKQNDCKILDHIGTQCHTSINDIEGLRESIKKLQQFGLPIDITELDISRELDGVDYKTATPEELNAIRKYEQKLQNDVMKMLADFVKEGKIRAITSWSITDELCCDFCDGKQASVTGMSYDENIGFVFQGKDMNKEIEMSEQEMQLIENHKAKVKENIKSEKKPIQDFCFHTHTERCGHGAKDTGDKEWIEHAIKDGIKKLAFTDHIPLPDGLNHKANSRMDIAEVETYLKSIQYFKEKYKGRIDIESGFEFEYSDRDLEHIRELKAKTDKMILGQHYVIDDFGIEYGIERGKGGKPISDEVLDMYVSFIKTGMEQGIPDIIAHPDLFMKARDSFGVKEQQITREICQKAIEYGIPLEINFGEIAKGKKANYPCKEFWELVGKEYGDKIKVVFGKDAHYPEQLYDEENPNKDYKDMISILGIDVLEKLQFVKGDLQTIDTDIIGRLEELKIKTTPMLNTSMAINYDKSMSPEEKVNYLAQNLRLTVNNLKELANWTNSTCLDTKWTPFKKDDYNIENDALNDEGKALTELLIKMQSNKEGMSFEKIDISSLSELYPEEQADLKSMLQNNTHSFTIVTIDDKKYIIDCAYRQFFEKDNSQKSDGTIDLENIMSNDEHSKALAEQILMNGWAEASPENIKTYLDGFIKATAKDTDVRLPNEEDYLKNIRGKDLDVGGKVIHRYEIKELWKPYVKRWSPNISEEILDFMQEHRDVFTKIKNNLAFSTETFSIISKDGKEYIRTEDGDVEYTPESLKTYLDTILIQAGETKDIVTPSIKEYHSLYPCGKPVAKDYKYIIDSKPYISDVENDNFSEEMTDEEKITSIVQKERRFLMRDNDLETASLAGECEDSTLRVLIDSTSKGFEDATCLFPSAYLEQGSAGHNCSIVKLNGKSYLIDCTYRQFFEEGLSEHCGKYMINDENRRNVAEQILRNGWIEATPENIKAYMDGFEMAKRKSFEETGITNEEYIKRLAEHETRPIHIVTKREILESGIDANMSIEEVQNAGQLLEEPVKSNEISISE